MTNKTRDLTLLAILTAMTVVLGLFAHIATATGVTTLLDVGIYFTAFYFGSRKGAIVGGLGAFLFDYLSGYSTWMFISLFAHGLQGYFAGWSGRKRPLGVLLGAAVMVGIYLLTSALMNGWGKAVAEVLTNVMQNVVGIAGGYLLYLAIQKTGLKRVSQ